MLIVIAESDYFRTYMITVSSINKKIEPCSYPINDKMSGIYTSHMTSSRPPFCILAL